MPGSSPNQHLKKFLGFFQNVCPPGASPPLDTPTSLGLGSLGLSGATLVGRLSSPGPGPSQSWGTLPSSADRPSHLWIRDAGEGRCLF